MFTLCSILGFLPILCLLLVPFLAMKGHRMCKMPRVEHQVIHSTLKAFFIQLVNYTIARKGAGIILGGNGKTNKIKTKDFTTCARLSFSTFTSTRFVFMKKSEAGRIKLVQGTVSKSAQVELMFRSIVKIGGKY